ncbi:MAG: DUF3048 domain-containing protein [Candidatus Buchananbacteria bacterium]|nr:DUF3048 domain-containing protein [Candidatus Buchananbacteria bacterium]
MNQEIKKFIQQWQYLGIVIFLAVLAAGFLFYYSITTENWLDWDSTINHQISPQTARWLDGVIVDSTKARLKPFAVMLENHVESRPVAGLEQASIVYESIVEGDITRFLAVFDQNVEVKKIGPVRSARPFFVELAQEWNPVYFHAGGSAEALAMLKKSEMYNINEISADGIYFWRDTSRAAPHNLFTSADQIRRAIQAKEIDPAAEFSPWQFKNDDVPNTSATGVTDIEVNFSSNGFYQVRYEYDPDNNNYTRYLGGKLHKTESGIILKAKNVIVQHVDYDIVDDYGRLAVDLDGSGPAEMYFDGNVVQGSWQRINGRTYFYDKFENQVSLNRGTTWVEIVFN